MHQSILVGYEVFVVILLIQLSNLFELNQTKILEDFIRNEYEYNVSRLLYDLQTSKWQYETDIDDANKAKEYQKIYTKVNSSYIKHN